MDYFLAWGRNPAELEKSINEIVKQYDDVDDGPLFIVDGAFYKELWCWKRERQELPPAAIPTGDSWLCANCGCALADCACRNECSPGCLS
jgi:hypothetical protein